MLKREQRLKRAMRRNEMQKEIDGNVCDFSSLCSCAMVTRSFPSLSRVRGILRGQRASVKNRSRAATVSFVIHFAVAFAVTIAAVDASAAGHGGATDAPLDGCGTVAASLSGAELISSDLKDE